MYYWSTSSPTVRREAQPNRSGDAARLSYGRMSDERSDHELLRRLRVTIALVVLGAVAGLLGAVLNSVPCELAFVVFAVLAVLTGWTSAVRGERPGP